MPIVDATVDTFRYASVEQLKPILRVLTSITWPCPAEAIPGIIDRLGWTLTADRVNVKSDTGLPLNWRLGDFSRAHGEFTEVGFPVTDVVSKEDSQGLAVVRQTFPIMVGQVESLVGPVSGTVQGTYLSAWWDLSSGGRIRVGSFSTGLQMQLLSQWISDVERYEETHDMSAYE